MKNFLLISFLLVVLSCETPERDEHGNVKRDSARELNIEAPQFEFLAHTGDTINNAFLKGNYYVADFFFTTCPSICPKMSSVISGLQDTFQEYPNIKFVSFTIDPKRDSIAVLKRYAKKYSANPSQWYLLHTEQKKVYELMEKGFYLSGAYNEGAADDITHSDRLVLVNPEGKILGYYEALDPELVESLIRKLRILNSTR